DAERGRAVCRGLHGPELGLTLGRRHGYFPLTRRKRGLRFLAPAEALRVRLASIAPASFLLTPSLAAMFFCTLLKLISNPSNSVGKTALCDSRVRAPRTRTTIAT